VVLNELPLSANLGVFLSTGVGQYAVSIMKSVNNPAPKSAPGVFRRHLNEFVVRPLAHLINRQRLDCIEQGRKIFQKLDELDDLVAIIARELSNRKVEGDKQ
jgi:hypothetical protein